MKKLLDFVRTTLIGGVLFLVPLVIASFVLSKMMGVVAKIVHPLVISLGVHSIAGVAASTIVTLIGLAIGAFLIGLFARTRIGQSFLAWIATGIASMLPQFNLIQGVTRSIDGGSEDEISVVLVPTDAGWQLGLVMEPPQGEWYAVFLPSSPQWSSGSVVYAHSDEVHPIEMPVMDTWTIMRRRGASSAEVCARLAELRAAGAV